MAQVTGLWTIVICSKLVNAALVLWFVLGELQKQVRVRAWVRVRV
jgi:hypothetical protein